MRAQTKTYTLLLLGWRLRKSPTDPMWHKYPHLTPYNCCANNPVRYIDPDGRATMFGDYYNKKGVYLGTDGKSDDKVYIITKSSDISLIKRNAKNSRNTELGNVKKFVETTRTELTESLDVLKRTEEKGGSNEEASVVTPDGRIVRGDTGSGNKGVFPYVKGNDNTSIHSHPLDIIYDENGGVTSYPIRPSAESDVNQGEDCDTKTFLGYNRNIIVGYLWKAEPNRGTPDKGIGIYNRYSTPLIFLTKKVVEKICQPHQN